MTKCISHYSYLKWASFQFIVVAHKASHLFLLSTLESPKDHHFLSKNRSENASFQSIPQNQKTTWTTNKKIEKVKDDKKAKLEEKGRRRRRGLASNGPRTRKTGKSGTGGEGGTGAKMGARWQCSSARVPPKRSMNRRSSSSTADLESDELGSDASVRRRRHRLELLRLLLLLG